MATSNYKYERVDMQSAQVISNITDLSRIQSSVPDYASVAVVTAPKGPANVAVLLKNVDDLIETFGKPTGDYIQLLCVYKMLELGQACWVVKVEDPFYASKSILGLPMRENLDPSYTDSTAESIPWSDSGFKPVIESDHIVHDIDAMKALGAYNKEPKLQEAMEKLTMPDLVKEEAGGAGTKPKATIFATVIEHELSDGDMAFSLALKDAVNVWDPGTEGDGENGGTDPHSLVGGKLAENILMTVTVTKDGSAETAKTVIADAPITDFLMNAAETIETTGTNAGKFKSDTKELDVSFLASAFKLAEEDLPDLTSSYKEDGFTKEASDNDLAWTVVVKLTDKTEDTPVDVTTSEFEVWGEYSTGSSSETKHWCSITPSSANVVSKENDQSLNGCSIVFSDVTAAEAKVLGEPAEKLRRMIFTDVSGNSISDYVSIDPTSTLFVEDKIGPANTDYDFTIKFVDGIGVENMKILSGVKKVFSLGNSGNSPRVEEEILPVTETVIVDGEEHQEIIGYTSPVVGYIDDSGNMSGMHVFLDKGIVAQTFPALGMYNLTTLEGMKSIADEREDLTCLFDTPPNMPRELVINWADTKCNSSEILSTQAFNCRFYWDWLYATVQSVEYLLPPSAFVAVKSLETFQIAGPWYPVAGSTFGVLDSVNDVCTKLPLTSSRDQLVAHRINPIHDTGNDGIQIYGNETLNYEYTDLRSAHIGATLTYIRSQVDKYTETLKFSLNNSTLWSTWQTHVMDKILAPIIAAGGLKFARARMGASLTTAEELSKRQVRGQIELQFVQDAEIFLLNYVVYASSADTESL